MHFINVIPIYFPKKENKQDIVKARGSLLTARGRKKYDVACHFIKGWGDAACSWDGSALCEKLHLKNLRII
jgi:hypothetical protein